MQLLIQFPDFSDTAAIHEYIQKRLRTLHRRLDVRYQNPILTLRGRVLDRRADGTPRTFRAEISIKIPRSKTPLFAQKVGTDFRTALSDAVAAMEKILRRDSEKRERSRKTIGKSLYPVSRVKKSGALPKKRA